MRRAFASAVGIQAVLVAASLADLGRVPIILLGLATIVVLLRSVKKPELEPKVEIETIETKVAERTKDLQEKLVIYERAASTDALTGLLNRRGMEDSIQSHLARSRRLKTAFSFVLCDIDHFKAVNDKFGHAVGDVVLVGVSKALRETLRQSDFAGRWGGEEFLVCLPDTDLAGAIMAAEKLRVAVERLDFEAPSVTISLGCAELGEDPFEVAFARADMNLYLAKSKGRNQVFPVSLQKVLDLS